MIFNRLSGYEKMTIQNSLLSLGINQDYLVAIWLEEWDNNPVYHPNGYAVIFSAMGLASLVIDDNDVRNFCDSIAKARIEHILDERKVCDSLGGWIEGITYSEYGTDYIVAYAEAERRVQGDTLLKGRPYPENYPAFRTYCTVFGTDRYSNVEVNFEDYNDAAWYANEGIMYLVTENEDSVGQWYLAHSLIKWPEWRDTIGYVCIDLVQRYFQFGPFLWFDTLVGTKHPDSIPLPLGRKLEGIGWAVIRNGWDSTSTVMAMKCGIFGGYGIYATHCHPAQNRFVFGSKGRWFIEETGYPPKEKKEPPWHNVILVNDTLNDAKKDGEIKRFYTSNDYSYIMGNDSLCDTRLDRWQREIVMVNDPGFIVVKDGIESNTNVMIDWRIHSHIGTGEQMYDKDSVITIKKAGQYLYGKIIEPEEAEWDTFPWIGKPLNWYGMSIDSIDCNTKTTYIVPFFIGDTFPEISKLPGSSVFATSVNYETSTDTTNGMVVFSKDCDDVKGLSYVVEVDPSDTIVFNVLADLYYSQEVQITDTVIDENLDTGTRQDTSLTPTSEGTASLEISGIGTHRITVFIPGKIESSSDDATSPNSTRRFLYEDSLERYHLLYEDNYQIMHGERFSNIDGWVEGYQIGEGEYPALASYTDTAGNSILNAVWAKEKVIFYSRFTYETGWSKPCSLVSYSGTHIPHYFPPSLAIDDSGKAHLAWGIVLQGTSEPCTVFSILRYSTFDAGLDTPSLSDTATLDSVVKTSSSSWSMGYASLDLYNDTISVVVWSRPIGAGKDTIYCKQETASGWPSSPEVVSSSSTKATKPFCDITGNSVYVVWEEEGVIKHRQRNITGEWISIETVSNTLLTSRNAQMVNENICVYTEVPQLQPNHRSHVVYRKRSGQGTWSSSTIIESTNYESEFAQSIFLERDLHVVWTEGNSSPYEIKYKKKTRP